MGMLEDAEQSLRGWRREHLTTTGAYNSTPTPVTQASTDVDTQFTDGLIVESKTVDWLIDAADLSSPPVLGDRIVVADVTYEVMAIGGKCWRWHGRTNSTYLIHSKAGAA